MSPHLSKDYKASKLAYDRKRMQKKYKLPVIGHFADRSIEFNSILEGQRIQD